jgi:hypothetical protein
VLVLPVFEMNPVDISRDPTKNDNHPSKIQVYNNGKGPRPSKRNRHQLVVAQTYHWACNTMQVGVQLTSLWLCCPVLLATELFTQTYEKERYTFDRSSCEYCLLPPSKEWLDSVFCVWLLVKTTHFSCRSAMFCCTPSSLSTDRE